MRTTGRRRPPCAKRAGIGAALLLGLVSAPCARPAAAEGLRRLDTAWVVPARLAALALDHAVDETTQGAWVRAGQTQLFGLVELPVRHLAVGLVGSRRSWALEGGWETVGAGLLRDDRLQTRLVVGRRLHVGADGRWRRVRPGPGPHLREQVWDLNLGFETPAGPLGRIDLSVYWPVFRLGDPALAPEPQTRLRLAAAAPGRAVALTIDTAADGRPTCGWEALCGLGAGLGLSWRADQASGAMGAGLLWQRGALRLRSSHLAHPDLGLTHRFEVALGSPAVSPW
jgi:hypothetical protein